MTYRDRLIELLEHARIEARETLGSMNDGFESWYADCLIANGVILPPCKVGDTIYLIGAFTKEIFAVEVVGMWIYEDETQIITDKGVIASEWYLTKEEAEKALKESL